MPERQLELPLPEPVPPRIDLVGDPLELVKAPEPRERYLDWARLWERTWGTDLLACPCGGRRRVVALVEDAKRAKDILEQLGLPSEAPVIARARAPPQQELFDPPPAYTADPVWADG